MKFRKTNRRKTKMNYIPLFSLGIIFLLLSFTFSHSYVNNFNWNGIRSEIKDSIIEFEKYGSITSKYVGYAGKTPQQWYRQNWLNENLNEKELSKLTEYPNGSVKGLAYWNLIKNKKVEKKELFEKALNDTLAFVHYQSGCIGTGFMLGEFVVSFVPATENIELKEILNKKERKEILNLLEKRKMKENFYKKEYYKTLK
ncbi:hypothetical protein ACFQ1Q_02305 [Winogradskyella litorisediminis]|uniref:GLPGLI family protein n=2 Tax=Winogradskyella litorisediminis TaxID=1156618 RepID=A0ABW3N6C0_9FLAO